MSNPIKASDLYKDDGAILDAIEQLGALQEAHARALKKVQQEAVQLRVEVQKGNVVNGQQREAMKGAAGEAEKLRLAYEKYQKGITDTARELAQVQELQKKQNTQLRLEAKLTESAEGSYDALSAQYGLLKIQLNGLSEEERKNTEEGRAMETQANAIYQQMKALQEATGKHVLSVGDYTKGIREAGKEQKKLVAELQEMEAAFEDASSSGIATAESLAQYEARIKELTEQIDNLGTVTGKTSKDFKGGFLDSLTQSEGALGGAARGVKGLGSAFKALLANPVVLVLSLIAGALATLGKAFKQSEAGAGIMARITGTLNGIWSVTIGLAADLFEGLMKAFKDPVGAMQDFWKALKENIVNRFEGVIKLAQSLAGVLKGLWDRDLEAIRTSAKEAGAALVQMGTGLDVEQQRAFSEAVKEQTDAVQAQIKAFADLETMKRRVANSNREIAKSIEALTTQEEYLLTIRDDNAKSFKEREDAGIAAMEAAKKRAGEEVRLAKNNLSLLNTELDLRSRNKENVQALLDQQLAAYREVAAAERGLVLATRESEREMAMIKQDRLEKDLDILIDGVDNQKTVNEKIIADETRTLEERAALLEETRRLVEESYQKQVATVQEFTGIAVDGNDLVATADAVALNQKIRSLGLSEIIEGRLLEVVRERRTFTQDLIDAEKALNAEREAAAQAELVRQKELLEAQKAAELDNFDQLVEFERSKLELAGATEAEKTRFSLEAERDRLAKLLELNERFQGDLTELQKGTMQNQIAALNAEIEKAQGEKGSIYDRLGLTVTPEQDQAIQDSFGQAKQAVVDYFAKRTELANQAVANSDRTVEAARAELDAEIAKANLGYAVNVGRKEKELKKAEEIQAKALDQQRKAQRAQQTIEAVQQAGNLITASSKIWATLGFPAAIPALAIMWGTFIASQAQAISLTKKQYGEGGYELLNYGGSHRSGNDIPLGVTRSGEQRTVERGEALAVFSRKQVQKYGPMLPQLVAMINAGTFEQHFVGLGEASTVQVQTATVNVNTRRMEEELTAIRKQGERQYTRDGAGNLVEVHKNIRKTYV